MEYNKLTLPDLIDKSVKKDALAWVEFIRRFSPLITLSVKKALSRYGGERGARADDIKDIQQNIITSLWSGNKLAEVKNRENINYWLAIVARNAAINHLKATREEMLIYDESFFEKLPAKETEQKISMTESADRKIEEILSRLSSREKIIFKLYFEKELGLKDISKIMDVPIGTVSSCVTRMRKKIKK